MKLLPDFERFVELYQLREMVLNNKVAISDPFLMFFVRSINHMGSLNYNEILMYDFGHSVRVLYLYCLVSNNRTCALLSDSVGCTRFNQYVSSYLDDCRHFRPYTVQPLHDDSSKIVPKVEQTSLILMSKMLHYCPIPIFIYYNTNDIKNQRVVSLNSTHILSGTNLRAEVLPRLSMKVLGPSLFHHSMSCMFYVYDGTTWKCYIRKGTSFVHEFENFMSFLSYFKRITDNTILLMSRKYTEYVQFNNISTSYFSFNCDELEQRMRNFDRTIISNSLFDFRKYLKNKLSNNMKWFFIDLFLRKFDHICAQKPYDIVSRQHVQFSDGAFDLPEFRDQLRTNVCFDSDHLQALLLEYTFDIENEVRIFMNNYPKRVRDNAQYLSDVFLKFIRASDEIANLRVDIEREKNERKIIEQQHAHERARVGDRYRADKNKWESRNQAQETKLQELRTVLNQAKGTINRLNTEKVQQETSINVLRKKLKDLESEVDRVSTISTKEISTNTDDLFETKDASTNTIDIKLLNENLIRTYIEQVDDPDVRVIHAASSNVTVDSNIQVVSSLGKRAMSDISEEKKSDRDHAKFLTWKYSIQDPNDKTKFNCECGKTFTNRTLKAHWKEVERDSDHKSKSIVDLSGIFSF